MTTCAVCQEPCSGLLCDSCGRSYDIALRKDSTIYGAIEWAADRSRRAFAKAQLEELREKYNDLIMSVGWVHKGETRHDTAKRYILAAENQNNPAANAEPKP